VTCPVSSFQWFLGDGSFDPPGFFEPFEALVCGNLGTTGR
jgi:hypothetical protein